MWKLSSVTVTKKCFLILLLLTAWKGKAAVTSFKQFRGDRYKDSLHYCCLRKYLWTLKAFLGNCVKSEVWEEFAEIIFCSLFQGRAMTPETKLPPVAECSSFGKDCRYPQNILEVLPICRTDKPPSFRTCFLPYLRPGWVDCSRAGLPQGWRVLSPLLSAFATLIYVLPTAALGKTQSILLMRDFLKTWKAFWRA